MLHMYLKRVCILLLLGGMLYKYQFKLVDRAVQAVLSIIERIVLTFPAIFELSVSPFNSVSFYFMYFGVFLLVVYMFIILMLSL